MGNDFGNYIVCEKYLTNLFIVIINIIMNFHQFTKRRIYIFLSNTTIGIINFFYETSQK